MLKKIIIITILISVLIICAAEAGTRESIIRAIEVEGLSRIEKEELIDLICLKVGGPLDRKELGKGVARAFKKGIFYDIRVFSEPYDSGIKLVYRVKEVPLIRRVNVKGNSYVRSRFIEDAFEMKEGENFRKQLLEEARTDLLEFFRRKGFPDADIALKVLKTRRPSVVDLEISVDENEPFIIREIDAPRRIRNYLTISEGEVLDRDRLDRDLERIREYYKDRNYLKPVVGPYKIEGDTLVIPVEKGPKLEVSFKGNERVGRRKLLKEVAFMVEEEISDKTIEESVKSITDLYLNLGYYNAQVAAGIETENRVIHVTFYIFEGVKVMLEKISFQGTDIPPESLKSILPLEEGREYRENLLDSSRESLINFYNALGYLQAEVTDVIKNFRRNGRDVGIEFVIREGPLTKIEEIRIEGNSDIRSSTIEKELRIEEGDPYNVVDIGDARYNILSLYSRYGYMEAWVDVESRIDKEKAFLTFRIKENRPSVIGKIIVRGNYKTKTEVVVREFTIREGDVYNYEEMLRIKQRLYKLGIFNEVSIEALDTARKKDGSNVRDVLVSLKEGMAGSIDITLGYGDYEKLRGGFGVSYRNVQGYNRNIGIRTELSSVEERFIFNFREPRLFEDSDISLNLFVLKEDTESVNLDTDEVRYRIDRLSFLAGIEKEFEKAFRANLNYEYSFVDTRDVKPDVILSKEDTGRLGIGSVSPSLFHDTRDDPFNPSSGSLTGVIVKFASPLFLSETEFIKGIFQTSWFFELTKKLVFACSFRSGAAYSMDENEELPLIERFFLGGRTTVRGYSQDSLGPTGEDGTPTGGNVFILGNTELRISVGKGAGLVLFVDGGNVWQRAKETETEAKFTAGAGLRYNTPVGPVRIDYGHKLDREEGESAGEVHFSFGHAF